MTPIEIDDRYLRLHPLPVIQAGDKHSRGRVLVIGGHREMPGAALLAGLGALRAGAGVLQIATCKSNASHLGVAMPEAMVIGCSETSDGEIAPENALKLSPFVRDADAVLIGPGTLNEDTVGELAAMLLRGAAGPTFVLDAAAFTAFRKIEMPRPQDSQVVCTPHFGEMAKFLDRDRSEIELHAQRLASEVARRLEAVVALKGATTHIVNQDGAALISNAGSIGLATSGSGDTLAGILAGLVARGAAPLLATAWAVYIHAEAGRRLSERIGPVGLLARELPIEIPLIMRDLANNDCSVDTRAL